MIVSYLSVYEALSSTNLIFPVVGIAILHFDSWIDRGITIAAAIALIMFCSISQDIPLYKYGLFTIGGIFFVAVVTNSARQSACSRIHAEHLSNELERANRELTDALAQASELATANERVRIAREIHDSLGHRLTGAHVHLQVAEQIQLDNKPASTAITNARRLLKQGIDDLREAVATQRTEPVSELPLAELIEQLAHESLPGIRISHSTAGQPYKLAPETLHALYRTAQEAFNNISKHAQASLVQVTLDYAIDPQKVSLKIVDNGVGGQIDSHGYGILGMTERAESLGGSLHIGQEQSGFAVTVEIPQ